MDRQMTSHNKRLRIQRRRWVSKRKGSHHGKKKNEKKEEKESQLHEEHTVYMVCNKGLIPRTTESKMEYRLCATALRT